jgi:hypothetical protein
MISCCSRHYPVGCRNALTSEQKNSCTRRRHRTREQIAIQALIRSTLSTLLPQLHHSSVVKCSTEWDAVKANEIRAPHFEYEWLSERFISSLGSQSPIWSRMAVAVCMGTLLRARFLLFNAFHLTSDNLTLKKLLVGRVGSVHL